MSVRARIVLLSLLLLLACFVGCVATYGTLEAIHALQQEQHYVKTNDVRLVRPWMSIHYVAHAYHIPENYLCQTLHVRNDHTTRSTSLEKLAQTTNQPLDGLILKTQHSIQTYRSFHRQHIPTPYVPQQPGNLPASPISPFNPPGVKHKTFPTPKAPGLYKPTPFPHPKLPPPATPKATPHVTPKAQAGQTQLIQSIARSVQPSNTALLQIKHVGDVPTSMKTGVGRKGF